MLTNLHRARRWSSKAALLADLKANASRLALAGLKPGRVRSWARKAIRNHLKVRTVSGGSRRGVLSIVMEVHPCRQCTVIPCIVHEKHPHGARWRDAGARMTCMGLQPTALTPTLGPLPCNPSALDS